MTDNANIVQQGDVLVPNKGPLVSRGLLRNLCAAATAFLNLKVIGGTFYVSGRNAVIDLTGNTTGAVQAGAAAIKSFTITGQGDEYLTGTFGGTQVPVYKPPQFRPSFYTDQNSNIRVGIDFTPHTYTQQTGLDKRLDGIAIGGVNVTFNEVLWPAYYNGDIVTAAYIENPRPTGAADKFIWQDLNTAGRQWGWVDTICYQGYARQIVNVGSKPYGGVKISSVGSGSSRLSGQTVNIVQVIVGTDSDPNLTVITPADITSGAMYYQDNDLGPANVWLWSASLSQWVNIIS